jgi:hypothetical protein
VPQLNFTETPLALQVMLFEGFGLWFREPVTEISLDYVLVFYLLTVHRSAFIALIR